MNDEPQATQPGGLRTSPSLAELVSALAAAQGQMTNARLDGASNSWAYATLDACWAAVRGPLSANGLAVVQAVSSGGATLTCTTRLLHKSGEWMESSLSLPVSPARGGNAAQAVGSAATYARRYGLSAMVGIAKGEEDDDGQAAGGGPPPPPAPVAAQHDPSFESARGAFFADLHRLGWQYEDLKEFLEWLGRPKPSQMMPIQRRSLQDWLRSEGGRLKIEEWERSRLPPTDDQ